MSIQKRLFLFLVFICQFSLAQNDSINNLREVIVSDLNLKPFSRSKNLSTISDSIIKKNQPSLTSLLQFNSTIHFKENGLGMVSSPSFRGTSAQQTAVIWNGININSQLLGQTDFNTISVRDYNSITVRAGGGSSIYGSGAIGGSVHLNTDLRFKKLFSNDLFVNYGSFETFGINNKTLISDEKTSLNIGISRNQSRNNYDYIGTDLKNENGQFENSSLNVGFGYKINVNHKLQFYSQFYESERNFPILFLSENKTKYLDSTSRNLLLWQSKFNEFTSDFKIAFLSEIFTYFPDIRKQSASFGTVKTALSSYTFGYQINKKTKLSTSIDITENKGKGSEILEVSRQIFGSSFLFRQQVNANFDYDLVIKKEITSNYRSPFLMSFGTNLKMNKFYILKINGSQNFRIPTFNDLYYGNSGNPNLVPETAIQADICNEFKSKNFDFIVTNFYIATKNLIQWQQINTVLKPENVSNTRNYGIEILSSYQENLKTLLFKISTTYAFTKAIDNATNLQLIFVPKHKLNSELKIDWKKLSFNFQHLFTGYVFTTSDNRGFLKEFQISNTGFYYNFSKKSTAVLGLQMQNIFNEKYQNTINRPMPGRNFSINLNLIL